MENIYPNNFLSQVIIRLDFANPIDSLRQEIPQNLYSEAIKTFPISEQTKVIRAGQFHLMLTKKSQKISNIQKEPYNEWIFSGKNREKELHISMEFFSIVYLKYSNFKSFKEDFMHIIKAFYNEYGEIKIKRIGLRYINLIKLDEKGALNWKKYLNSKLICGLNVYNDKNTISRAFNVLDVKIDDIMLKFQYGMHNPDFPAVIHKKEFVLDFDAHYDGSLQNPAEIEKYLEMCRKPIKFLFELSIKDPLREKMK